MADQSGTSDSPVEAMASATVQSDDPVKQREAKDVEKRLGEIQEADQFDRNVRAQYARDRRYAAGLTDPTWAVDANLLGTYIDILVTFLYARDPDVSARPAPRVDGDPPRDMVSFARTAEIVVGRQWKGAKLKRKARRQVRSVLTTGPGWIKAIMRSSEHRSLEPEATDSLNDIRDNIARYEAMIRDLQAEESPTDEAELKLTELRRQEQAIQAKVEVRIRKGLIVDFLRSERVTVSLDVDDLSDYLSADWISNDFFVRKDEITTMFPRITAQEAKGATTYYQRRPRKPEESPTASEATEKDAEQFVKDPGSGDTANPVEFARVIEMWDRRDTTVKTMVEGVPFWAKLPFTPQYATTRFYPYFLVGFYWCDGYRDPQSLAWRLHKLQDEYASTRSNERLTRERSIPGTLFDKGGLESEDARALEKGTQQEFTGVKVRGDKKIGDLFTEKPIATAPAGTFETESSVRDMERISGVQEALQGAITTVKTATEAEIQQSGMQARTSADRDELEEMLNELALYTLELALQCLTVEEVQRMAGPGAFWPHGMDPEDLLTMVEIEIQGGTTGKPNVQAERDAWRVLLPLVRQTMQDVLAAQAAGQMGLAEALTELLRETLRRLDDRIDVDRFIPQLEGMVATNMGGAPGDPGAPPPVDPEVGDQGAPPVPDQATDPRTA